MQTSKFEEGGGVGWEWGHYASFSELLTVTVLLIKGDIPYAKQIFMHIL